MLPRAFAALFHRGANPHRMHPPPPSPALAGAAAAEERCIIRYSKLRAVPVFLPPARSVARRSSASHPVFHGLGDRKLTQTGFRTQRP